MPDIIIKETNNYRLVVTQNNDERVYVVQNTDYGVVEMVTPVLPEAFQFMEQVQQFYTVNIKPTQKTIIE